MKYPKTLRVVLHHARKVNNRYYVGRFSTSFRSVLKLCEEEGYIKIVDRNFVMYDGAGTKYSQSIFETTEKANVYIDFNTL